MGEAYGCPGSTLRLYLQAAFKPAQILLRAMASPCHLEKGGVIACIKLSGLPKYQGSWPCVGQALRAHDGQAGSNPKVRLADHPRRICGRAPTRAAKMQLEIGMSAERPYYHEFAWAYDLLQTD